MGTNKTVELQNDIKQIINQMGWSQNYLAEVVYIALHDDDLEEDETGIAKAQARIKKEFQRTTTKPEKLQTYLEIISRHPDFQKLDLVMPQKVMSKELSQDFLKGMQEISKSISRKIEEKENL